LVTVCVTTFVATVIGCVHASPTPEGTLVRSLWSLGGCTHVLESQGALVLARVWIDHEWWRVVTTGFLHGSWIHLLVNCWSLWVVGEWAEVAWGSARTVGLFVASCASAGLASMVWCEAPTVIGASGGVMGLAGGVLVARSLGEERLRARLAPVSPRLLGGFLLVLVALGALLPQIAQAGHIGGLGAGLAIGFVLSRTGRWKGLAWVAVGAGLAGMAGAAARPAWSATYHELAAYRWLELGRMEAAARGFDRALAERPGDAGLQNAVAYALAEAGVELGRAERLVRAALEAEPDNADYLDTLGWILCRGGRAEAGRAVLGRAAAAADRPIAEVAQHQRECGDAAAQSARSDK
jgi:membrane associated rhomboid family serine protease